MVDYFSPLTPKPSASRMPEGLQNRAPFRRLDMVTIGYYPATGMNTIRLSSDKYEWVNPGDLVVMKYVEKGTHTEDNPIGKVIAMEKLTVRSVAYVPGHLVEDSYMHSNHAVYEPATGRRRSCFEIWEQLEECYGAEVTHNPDTLFAVISFE